MNNNYIIVTLHVKYYLTYEARKELEENIMK